MQSSSSFMFNMDGLGFIANLHATTLDQQGSTPRLGNLVRKQTRRSSSGSLSDKAKSLLVRSRTFLSTSSHSSILSRVSTSSFSPRTSEQGCEEGSVASFDLPSAFATSTSSTHSGEDPPRSPYPHSSPCPQVTKGPVDTASPLLPRRNIAKGSSWGLHKTLSSPRFDPTWISTLVDNGYNSPHEPSPPGLGDETLTEGSEDVKPSRASSMLDCDLVQFSRNDDPTPVLPPVPSGLFAGEVTFSLGELKYSPSHIDHQDWGHNGLGLGTTQLLAPQEHTLTELT